MQRVKLGRTGLTVNKNGFGALPVQRVGKADALALLQRAYEAGIDYFDTARSYTDSEEKLGAALAPVRDKIIIATKTAAATGKDLKKDLDTSLGLLKTDYIDVYQLHNPAFCPRPGDGSGLYEALEEARAAGKIRHIGITNHRLAVAREAVESGLYELLQFPFSYLADEQDEALVRLCAQKDVGFVAMKALSGGLINDGATAFAWMAGWENVLPIWGVQRMKELEEFLACAETPPALTPERLARIETDRAQLAGSFCRGCGYCMPCPAGIQINMCARMSLLLRRAPVESFLTPAWQKEMAKIPGCTRCGQCEKRCPYGLVPHQLLKENYQDYQTFVS